MQTSGGNGRSILESVRDVAFICAIYLFFAGFLYQYFWYQALGIPFKASEVGLNQTLVFAYYTFADNIVSVAIACVVVGVVALALVLLARRFTLPPRTVWLISRGLLILGAVLVFPLLYSWSRVATFEALAHPLSGHPDSLVQFTIKDSAKSNYDRYFYADNGATLTLVAESDKFLYALAIPTVNTDPCGKRVPQTFVFAVNKDDVESMRTLLPARERGVNQNGASNAAPKC
jgi:hypothetical protein